MLNQRTAAAIAIVGGAVLLCLLLGLVVSVRYYGFAVLAIPMIFAAMLAFGGAMWLKGHGISDYAGYANRAALGLLLGAILPAALPGSIAYAKSWVNRWEASTRRAAIEGVSPKAVPCGNRLVSVSGTLYWFHPADDPRICYDREGNHPHGKGALLPVTEEVAQIIEAERARRPAERKTPPAAAPPPPGLTEEQVRAAIRDELAKNQPLPEPPVPSPAPQAALVETKEPPKGSWLEVPN
jgi:hypothetical protein